ETWDTLGMRATQSQDTILEGAFVPDRYVPVVCPAGLKGAGLFHLSIFAWGLLGIAGVYASLARRAYDLTVENLPRRNSVFLTRSTTCSPTSSSASSPSVSTSTTRSAGADCGRLAGWERPGPPPPPSSSPTWSAPPRCASASAKNAPTSCAGSTTSSSRPGSRP